VFLYKIITSVLTLTLLFFKRYRVCMSCVMDAASRDWWWWLTVFWECMYNTGNTLSDVPVQVLV